MVEDTRSAREVCADLGIEIVRPGRRSTDGLPQTCAERTIGKMLRRHGEPHTIFVLRTIAETEGNSGELVAHTVEAVSRLVLAHPRWADRGLEWFDAFDRIDLPAIRDQCRKIVRIVPMASGIATVVFDRLFGLLGSPEPEKKRRGGEKHCGRVAGPVMTERESSNN